MYKFLYFTPSDHSKAISRSENLAPASGGGHFLCTQTHRNRIPRPGLLTLPPLEFLSIAEQDRLTWAKGQRHIFVHDAAMQCFQAPR